MYEQLYLRQKRRDKDSCESELETDHCEGCCHRYIYIYICIILEHLHRETFSLSLSLSFLFSHPKIPLE